MNGINKVKLKKALMSASCGCDIQHDGWPCGTCFFEIGKSIKNEDWQNVLLIRGDYKEGDLSNLPEDRLASYNKILKLCRKREVCKSV